MSNNTPTSPCACDATPPLDAALRALQSALEKERARADDEAQERDNMARERLALRDEFAAYRASQAAALRALQSALEKAEAERESMRTEMERLRGLIDAPHNDDWFEGVRIEAAHQVERWGSANDAGKTPLDWFWLIGYLAQKAATSQSSGDVGKATHHTISTGAAMLNWYRAINGINNFMRPGIEPPALAGGSTQAGGGG